MVAGVRRLLSLLEPGLRRQWFALLPLSALCALLEAAGALAVYGLIRVIGDPASGERAPALFAASPGGVASEVALLAGVLAVFYLAKNGLSALLAVRRNRVASRSIAALSARLFRAYLKAPYARHLRRNSAELVRNATDSCEVAFESVAKALLVVATELLVLTGLVLVLLVAAPWITLLSIALLFAGLALVLRLTQRSLDAWGRRAEERKVESIRRVQQSLGGLRELKVMGRGEFFGQQFAQLQDELAALRERGMNLVSAPPLLIETGFVLSMLVVVVLLVAQGEDAGGGANAGVLPLLGLYAYAGFRAIPSMHRISMNFNFARFGLAAVENLERDLADFESEPDAETPPLVEELSDQLSDQEPAVFAEEISLEKVSFQYEGASSLALDSIDLRIARGESLGVVGRTGSGKSTLVDLLLGLLSPSDGRVAVDGRDIGSALAGWQSQLGYVPQDVYLMDDTLLRNVARGFADDEIDTPRVERAVARAQLAEFVRNLPDGLQTVVGERGVRLSGGEVQRVAIARALYHEPQLIIFDEATSSLDPATEAELTAAIERLHADEAGVTLVTVTHRIATVAGCDRLVFLEQGRLAGEGRYADLVAENSAFRAMLGEV